MVAVCFTYKQSSFVHFFKVCWASQPVDSIDCASSLKHQKTTVWIDGLVNLFSVFELSVQTFADKLFEDYLSQLKINLKFKQVENNSSNAFRICWPRHKYTFINI